MADSPLVCVDSCVFISHLKGDADTHRTDQEKSDLRAFFTDFVENKVHIIFPTFERSELLACNLPSGAMEIFEKFIARPNLDEVPTSQAISTLAGEIRNHVFEKREQNPSIGKLSTPDAIVLATAITYKCDKLLTYDGSRPDGNHRRLLGMNGDVAGHALHIVKPSADHFELPPTN